MAGPLGAIVNLVSRAKEEYSKNKSDPVIPVPGRDTSGTTLAQPSNKANANLAADMLKVPGRDVVRGAAAKRKQQLDDM